MAMDMGKFVRAGRQLKSLRRENEVGQQEMDGALMLCAELQGIRAIVRAEDGPACFLKNRLTQIDDGGFVINHQDG